MSFRWLGVLLAICVLGCTKQNPRACSSDGMCSDPQYPFCDVNGTLGGSAGECIAVSCTPMQIGECRGSDSLLTCNAGGNGYDTSTCDLGCAPDRTHCSKVSASNGLDMYFDMVSSPMDLILPGPATIDSSTGAINGSPPTIPSFLVGAPSGGAAIRVYVAKRIDLGDVTVSSPGQRYQSVPAVAFLATSDITVSGSITLTSLDLVRTAGGVSFSECEGGASNVGMMGSYYLVGGGGGGGHATAGGTGGTLGGQNIILGGTPGGPSGTPELVPLRGGCGATWETGTEVPGGGAIQLTSLTSIHVGGTIDVTGTPGQQNMTPWIIGGGAGGGILLEAPAVEIQDAAKLLATGGGGASTDAPGAHSPNASPAIGGACVPARDTCGAGGAGAAPGSPAVSGYAPANSSTTANTTGGAGGGGLGRIRINTIDGTYTKGANSILAADVTTGPVRRR